MKAMSQTKIETYLKVQEEEFKNPRPSADATQEEAKGKSAPSTYERDNRAAAKVFSFSLDFVDAVDLSSYSTGLLVGSWLLCIQHLPCSVSFQCMLGGSMEV